MDDLRLAPFQWTNVFELGHQEIDRQHQQLFGLGKAVIEPPNDGGEHKSSSERLLEMTDFAKQHFAFEESLMRANAFPDADRHAHMHKALMEDLSRYCAAVHWNWSWDDIPDELTDFLWRWLALHIDSSDRDFIAWLKTRREIDPAPAA